MRVTFVPGMYDGCWYVRCDLPARYNGWYAGKGSSFENDKEALYREAMQSDVVVFQRPNDPQRVELMHLLKLKGKKVVMDNDDTYLPGVGVPIEKMSNGQIEIAEAMNANLYQAAALADLIVTTTETLKQEYLQINPNVVVLPNCIDPLDQHKRIPNKTGKYRVGFIGSVSSNDDYYHVQNDIKRLDERGDVTIVVFGIKQSDGAVMKSWQKDFGFWDSLKNVEWQPFVPIQEYFYTINTLALDLAIIPRKDNYFNRCKSNLKYLECSLLGIPVVAQSFPDGDSPYDNLEHIQLVGFHESWYNKIVELLADKVRRQEMARNAKSFVLENYNAKKLAILWKKEFEKLCK